MKDRYTYRLIPPCEETCRTGKYVPVYEIVDTESVLGTLTTSDHKSAFIATQSMNKLDRKLKRKKRAARESRINREVKKALDEYFKELNSREVNS